MTEISTALGMLDIPDLLYGISKGAEQLIDVSESTWISLAKSVLDEKSIHIASMAFKNGRAFLESSEGLRGRTPVRISWKGPTNTPGQDLIPADLVVDYVYLVSCKYLSKNIMNGSPSHVFEQQLSNRPTKKTSDWYQKVALVELERLYECFSHELRGEINLPSKLSMLSSENKKELKKLKLKKWPGESSALYLEFAQAVSENTVKLWQKSLPKLVDQERLLWRMLRMADVTYFLLGAKSVSSPLRLRVATPWEWRKNFELKAFEIFSKQSGQPRVEWVAVVNDLGKKMSINLTGHVEIRWSHGKFCGSPEAKIYLDSPIDGIPGYYPLNYDTEQSSHHMQESGVENNPIMSTLRSSNQGIFEI
ncbi:MAG: hypothetical protein HKL80_04035 [Acidimicrobiales bacterium]|nr:hypothetical protein [Acidimicrobiales bacterium]